MAKLIKKAKKGASIGSPITMKELRAKHPNSTDAEIKAMLKASLKFERTHNSHSLGKTDLSSLSDKTRVQAPTVKYKGDPEAIKQNVKDAELDNASRLKLKSGQAEYKRRSNPRN